mmetsp:Transcript_5026/g.16547  ORF Transcript_5026/g.16547 Transcript_5026/m.16547 type:complete len:209 (-) Transcript_5026:2404-3030(-)
MLHLSLHLGHLALLASIAFKAANLGLETGDRDLHTIRGGRIRFGLMHHGRGGCRRGFESARFLLLARQSGDLSMQLGFSFVRLHQNTLGLLLEFNHFLSTCRAREALELGDEIMLLARRGSLKFCSELSHGVLSLSFCDTTELGSLKRQSLLLFTFECNTKLFDGSLVRFAGVDVVRSRGFSLGLRDRGILDNGKLSLQVVQSDLLFH